MVNLGILSSAKVFNDRVNRNVFYSQGIFDIRRDRQQRKKKSDICLVLKLLRVEGEVER